MASKSKKGKTENRSKTKKDNNDQIIEDSIRLNEDKTSQEKMSDKQQNLDLDHESLSVDQNQSEDRIEQEGAVVAEDDKNKEDEGGDKKKKKKKKEKDKEKKETKEDIKKSKHKKHIDAIREALRKKQEAEEEALLKLKEEQERLEALQRQKEEQERLAQEKKEREKQKKKDREARLKAEGKYLTPAQKEKLRKQQAMLDSADVCVAALEDEAPQKRPTYVNKKKQQRQKQQQQKESNESSVVSRELSEEGPVVIEEENTIAEDAIDVADDWEQVEIVESKNDFVQLDSQSGVEIPGKIDISVEPIQPVDTEKEVNYEESDESSSEASSSEEEEEEEEGEEDEKGDTKETKEQLRDRIKARMAKRREEAEAARSTALLRAPVICVLGHVDTGKTKMLDTIRRTNVQDGEAGGITQQIGATQVPAAAIKERCKMVKDFVDDQLKIPGFLIIDTPGHESFANLRSRGSSLCDLAILVVDIMHGLEPQTIESLKLLTKRRTPFVVALNKIDRLYGWDSNPRKDIRQLLKSQEHNVQMEFKDRLQKIKTEFSEQALNVTLAWENDDPSEYVSIVPTSAFLGDGIGNIMAHIAQYSQTTLAQRLSFSRELDCTVMEVKQMHGMGTTIDVILVNGSLNVNDVIVLAGTEKPITTQIRELLMPQPLKELRVKNPYNHFKTIQGAQGVKILAKQMEKALAGLPLYVAHREDEIDVLREKVREELSRALHSIKLSSEGVYVQASTLGSLEALLEFLRHQKIPYCGVNIGPVHKKDVMKASTMLEHNSEFAVILAFDVKVERESQQHADSEGVRIFQADIIYHLEDAFLKYREELRLKRRRDNEQNAIFPCKLRILPQHIYNARNPIVCGVIVEAGQLKIGTPICVPSKESSFLGTVSSIERNHEKITVAKSGDEICVKIENTTGDAPKMYGRHFTHEDALVSRISRETIDVCKRYFREDLSKADWQLVVQLKKLLGIY